MYRRGQIYTIYIRFALHFGGILTIENFDLFSWLFHNLNAVFGAVGLDAEREWRVASVCAEKTNGPREERCK